MTRPAWHDYAACTPEDVDLFFGENGTHPGPARAICARCPVRQTCLDYAVEHGIRHGIWGGLTPHERRSVRFRAARSIA